MSSPAGHSRGSQPVLMAAMPCRQGRLLATSTVVRETCHESLNVPSFFEMVDGQVSSHRPRSAGRASGYAQGTVDSVRCTEDRHGIHCLVALAHLPS